MLATDTTIPRGALGTAIQRIGGRDAAGAAALEEIATRAQTESGTVIAQTEAHTSRVESELDELAKRDRADHATLIGDTNAVLIHHFAGAAARVSERYQDLERKIQATAKTESIVPVLFKYTLPELEGGNGDLPQLALVMVDANQSNALFKSNFQETTGHRGYAGSRQVQVHRTALSIIGKAITSGGSNASFSDNVQPVDELELRYADIALDGQGSSGGMSAYTATDEVRDEIMKVGEDRGFYVGWQEIQNMIEGNTAESRSNAYEHLYTLLDRLGFTEFAAPQGDDLKIIKVLRARSNSSNASRALTELIETPA